MRLWIIVTIAISLTPTAFAQGPSQQKSLQSQLEGTWKITAAYDQFTDGHKRNPWGDNPQGIADYTSNGTLIFQLMGGDRSAKPDNCGGSGFLDSRIS